MTTVESRPQPGRHADQGPSPLAHQVGRIMRRVGGQHRDTPVEEWPWLAVEVLAIPEVWRALQYRERALAVHFPRPRVAGSKDLVCDHCRTWPCDDAIALGVAR